MIRENVVRHGVPRIAQESVIHFGLRWWLCWLAELVVSSDCLECLRLTVGYGCGWCLV